jgi:hypothetical protein
MDDSTNSVKKLYVGAKIIKAWPKSKDGYSGYAVEYPDGYTSWSPVGTFEECYREISVSEKKLIANE